MTIETPESISRWAQETFGPTPIMNIATRANVEMAELLQAVLNYDPPEDVAEECADVQIMLRQIYHAVSPGRDLVGFCETGSMTGIAVLANVKMSLLVNAIAAGSGPDIIAAAVKDVSGPVASIFKRVSPMIHLEAAIAAKMEINRGRKWARASTGQMQHV